MTLQNPLDTLPLAGTEIRRWIGEQSFSRGASYYRHGAITNPRRSGMTLQAQCHGSGVNTSHLAQTDFLSYISLAAIFSTSACKSAWLACT